LMLGWWTFSGAPLPLRSILWGVAPPALHPWFPSGRIFLAAFHAFRGELGLQIGRLVLLKYWSFCWI